MLFARCGTETAILTTMKLIELIEPAATETDAQRMLEFCNTQVNSRGGRVLPAGAGKPIRCQAFFNDEPEATDDELAYVGLRRVIVTPGMITALGVINQ